MSYSKSSTVFASLLVFLPVVATAQKAQENVVPLKTWAAPLYWQPNQAEATTAGKALPQLQFSANAVSTNALTFVAITPCRLVDTRGTTAGFNGNSPFSGPSIASLGTITIPVQSASGNTEPAPCGTIPSIAQGYSLNLTVVPHASGPVDYVTMWPAGGTQPFVSTLDDPQGAIVSNAAIVPAGTPNGGISVFNDGPSVTDVIIDMNGYYAAPTDLSSNTALGSGTLASNTSGSQNTAIGANALADNTTGTLNTAIGGPSLSANTTGTSNTAIGAGSLVSNTSGGSNTAVGQAALFSNTTGGDNTATGTNALFSNTTAGGNTADGYGALNANTTGGDNTAVGAGSLNSNTTGNSNTAIGQLALGVNTTGYANVAAGQNALANNTTGVANSAVGQGAMIANTSGMFNAALGGDALQSNTTGNNNTATGQAAMQLNTTGCCNTASGQAALNANTTGNGNSAFGGSALQDNTTGTGNTALGQGALVNNTTGSGSIAIGQNAASSVSVGNGNNIEIGSVGASGDSGATRIGTSQTSFFAAGISGVNVSGVAVMVSSSGQLGVTSSSRRYKEDIQDMGDASSGLLRLRPVTFRYKQPFEDGSKPIEYGLIAEEVAEVYPDLVARSANGQIETVKYQVLDSMLLNEMQKQAEQIKRQADEIQELETRLAALEGQR